MQEYRMAVFGLGRMGGQIARRLHKKGFKVLAWNRSPKPVLELKKKGIKATSDIKELFDSMSPKGRVLWLMLPHATTGEFIDRRLKPFLKKGDIVVDGGNSFYEESMARGKKLARWGVHFFDCGTSGGIWGEKNGFALMVGGPAPLWGRIEPFIRALSNGQNYAYLGKSGAGHFAKMVHNGIEYGMMEAIGEGYAVLEKSRFNYDLGDVTKVYKKGTVIRSWLIDLCENIFKENNVKDTVGKIDATGEGEWTIKTAKKLGVDVQVIEEAFKVRKESANGKGWHKFSNKIVALLRKQFGGHAVYKK